MSHTFSNVSARDFAERRRQLAAAFREGIPPPPAPENLSEGRRATRCRYAEDTGELAFLRMPCRGNRIRCRRLPETYSFTRNCQPAMCRFYEEAAEETHE